MNGSFSAGKRDTAGWILFRRHGDKMTSYYRPGRAPSQLWVAAAPSDTHPHQNLESSGRLVGLSGYWWSLFICCLRSKSVYMLSSWIPSLVFYAVMKCIMLVLFFITLFLFMLYTRISHSFQLGDKFLEGRISFMQKVHNFIKVLSIHKCSNIHSYVVAYNLLIYEFS